MDFDYSDEQQLLRDSVERFVREQYAFDTRRGIVASARGFSARNWQLFAELGWLALPVAEDDGGLGGNLTDLAILFEQFGKGLVVEPYLATVVLGAGLVSGLGSLTQREATLPAIMAGELQLAVAFAEPDSRYSLARIATTAARSGEGWTLDGRKCVVLNAPNADAILVSAREANGAVGIFRVAPGSAGLQMHAYATIDGGRAADIALDDVRVAADALLGTTSIGLAALARVIERATLCVCAEAVGAMDALLYRTVEYTKTRKQFGVAIASFQALQHRMAGDVHRAGAIALDPDDGADGRRGRRGARAPGLGGEEPHRPRDAPRRAGGDPAARRHRRHRRARRRPLFQAPHGDRDPVRQYRLSPATFWSIT